MRYPEIKSAARRIVWALGFSVALGGPIFANAQTLSLQDLESDALERSGIANILPALGLFGLQPGLRQAHLAVEATPLGTIDIDLTKVPLAYEFAPVWRGIRPFAQITLGHFDLDHGVKVAVIPAFPTGLDVSMSGEALIGGIGATIPLSDSISLRPMLLAGYARIRSEAATTGPFSGLVLSVVDGILADARLESPVVGGSVELRHNLAFEGGVAVDSALGFGMLYAPVTEATSRTIEQAIPFPTVSASLEADGPLWQAAGGPALRWLGTAGINYFPALPDDIAGLPVAAELGIGLEILGPDLGGGLTLRASAILGDRVTGWSFGASLRF